MEFLATSTETGTETAGFGAAVSGDEATFSSADGAGVGPAAAQMALVAGSRHVRRRRR